MSNIGMMKVATDEIKYRIRRLGQKATTIATEMVADDMYEIRDQILSQFYDYQGKDGKDGNADSRRYGDLWDALIVDSNSKGKRGTATFSFNPEGMKGKYGYGNWHPDSDYILDLIMNQGIRGLPKRGSEPMKLESLPKERDSFNFQGHTFKRGEHWENPYWGTEYHNIFNPSVTIGSFKSTGTPMQILEDYIYYWETDRMDDIFDAAIEKALKQI